MREAIYAEELVIRPVVTYSSAANLLKRVAKRDGVFSNKKSREEYWDQEQQISMEEVIEKFILLQRI